MDRDDATEAFTLAYLSYLHVLTRLVRKFLHGTSIEVEDVLQDIWIKGARGWSSQRDHRVYRSWLGKIAINAALEARKRIRHRPAPEFLVPGEAATDVPDPAALPDELALRRQMLVAVDALENRIPKQIAALRAVYLEGYTYLEAAEALGIAEGTAKSNVHKAIATLHASLTASEAA